ncbi:MAG: hypothetical protein GY820_46880 [Gammaproteobacteria bacterium]|nr:hypothetical protein [Gammaproteobacteria bacterium]
MRKQKVKTIESVIYISALLLAVGVFLPLTKLPIYGEVTLHRVAEIESYLVIAFAISAPLFLIAGQPKLIKLAVIGVWVTLLFPALKGLFESGDGGFLGKLGDKASSAMNDFAADLFLNIADFHWGGIIFLSGLVLFTASCLFRPLKK